MKDKINAIQNHQWAALAIAAIVALAEGVIVYELQLSGAWLVPDWLAWLKTIAFMLLFVGSLIAEMQQLAPRVRWLLIATVVILGLYQAFTNAWGNYFGANIPTSAVAFFNGLLTDEQVRRGFAIVDALTRTAVVVLMWLVTGLVWKGAAIHAEAATAPQADIAELQAQLEAMRGEVAAVRIFAALPPKMQGHIILKLRNGSGPTNEKIAELCHVNPSTVHRWSKQ